MQTWGLLRKFFQLKIYQGESVAGPGKQQRSGGPQQVPGNQWGKPRKAA